MLVPNPSEQPTMTIDEARTALRLSRSSAYDAARSGDLPTVRVGRRLLVPTAALRRMLQLDEVGGSSDAA
jgi:excisionase family DNA binding protein